MAYLDPEKQKAAWQKHYAANKDKVKARAKLYNVTTRHKVRQWILEYLQSHPCVDCGENDPIVLEFDHQGNKDFNIGSSTTNNLSLKRVMAEVEKCLVRCANCHRKKTYSENGWTHKG